MGLEHSIVTVEGYMNQGNGLKVTISYVGDSSEEDEGKKLNQGDDMIKPKRGIESSEKPPSNMLGHRVDKENILNPQSDVHLKRKLNIHTRPERE